MAELFHLADGGEWLAAAAAGEYRVSTRGVTLAEQGFIHCSLRHHLRGVADRYYADAHNLVLLVIDSERVASPIRYEAPAGGAEEYPHLYGPLPAEAVTAVVLVGRDQDGRLLLPEHWQYVASSTEPPDKAAGQRLAGGQHPRVQAPLQRPARRS